MVRFDRLKAGAFLFSLLLFSLSAVRTGAISFWGESATPTPTAPGEQVPQVIAPTTNATPCVPDFSELAERLSPAVVNISTTSTAPTEGRSQIFPGPFGRGPEEFFEPFERFFGPPRQFRQRSLGSGFIINHEGFILTNNHVVENADQIMVRLSNEQEYKARLIGRDPKTDIAVIKIDNVPNLTVVTMGNSDELKVGEWVLAIGNPFGLDHTVTAGIVSAKGRYLGQGSYDQFIQTDAAINPGNSGGPLINTRGEVVGINTAIFSRSGGNIGIGFAIPINLAKELLPELEAKGKVTRGWLGVLIQRVTPDIADSLGLAKPEGALVADVVQDSPAAEAGIKVGDVIVEFDGHTIKESNELPLLVARTPVGKTAKVKVLRDGKPVVVEVKIGELKEEEPAGEPSGGSEQELGITVQPLTPEIAESLGLSRDLKGMVVARVEPGSPADEAGLRRGDVILEVNREPVKDLSSYRKALKLAANKKTVLLLVRRGENTIFIAIKRET
ncbi:MAG: DegQ family serine endoprotease [Candidatus Binatia bacterium]|nr:DegQ family serine endoprotease [Candidatus Binatia bacterium]